VDKSSANSFTHQIFDSDPNLIDTIDVSVSTEAIPFHHTKLVETGTHTGIFAGSVTLTGDPSLKEQKELMDKV